MLGLSIYTLALTQRHVHTKDTKWKESVFHANKASEADSLNERDIGTLEEGSISFRLSGPNERLSQND